MYEVQSPILFLIFNRKEETQILFNAIRDVRPKKLYVAADGPRENENDILACHETKLILKKIDWDCELITLFRKENLGCGKAVSRAITWFFENENEGIILEDDCLPNRDFFRFCDSMLEKYRFDNRIGHICGSNFQDGKKIGDGDYYFSHVHNIWGWATWKRVWSSYDFEMTFLQKAQKVDFLSSIYPKMSIKRHLNNEFESTQKKLIDTWDYQYVFLNLVNGYLSIVPNNNMISNIGFGSNATHTFDMKSPYANVKSITLNEIIRSPSIIVPNLQADEYSLKKQLPSTFVWILRKIKRKIVNIFFHNILFR